MRRQQRYWSPPLWDRDAPSPPVPWEMPGPLDDGAEEEFIHDDDGPDGTMGPGIGGWEGPETGRGMAKPKWRASS